MKKHYTLLLLLVIGCVALQGQSWKLMRYELVLGTGTSTIFGDFVGVSAFDNSNNFGLKDIKYSTQRPSITLAMRYKVTNVFSARINFFYGRGYADGEKKEIQQKKIKAVTDMIEFSPQFEYYFLREERKARSSAIFNRRGMINNYSTFSSYLFAGVGGLVYRPKLIEGSFENRLNNKESEFKYNQMGVTAVFPVGIGFKYILDSRFILGAEIGRRFTFSDYIDGFGPSIDRLAEGNKQRDDTYYFTSVYLAYKLRTKRNGLPELFVKNPNKTGGLPFFAGGSAKAASAKAAKEGEDDPNKGLFKFNKTNKSRGKYNTKSRVFGSDDKRKINNPRKK